MAKRKPRDDIPAELNFDDDRAAPTRHPDGDPRDRTAQEARRYDEGGGVPDGSVDNTPTADDLEPETLLDETGGGTPLTTANADDSSLSIVDESEIGGGQGLDEAELAIAEGGGPDGADDLDDEEPDDEEPDDEDE